MLFRLWRNYRRRQWADRPLPDEWKTILRRRLPFYATLSAPRKKRFHRQLQVFLSEKVFTGVQGMEVTDEVRLTIAGCAVRLTLNLNISYYDRLSEIVVYPFDFLHPDEGEEIEEIRTGETHEWGVVILSWPSVLEGLEDPKDGYNTAYHEFAHALDRATGAFDGTPRLARLADYSEWAETLSRHYLLLREGEPGHLAMMDDYGAQSEAEFFAVLTEAYFETPEKIRHHAPDLYRELRRFYGLLMLTLFLL